MHWRAPRNEREDGKRGEMIKVPETFDNGNWSERNPEFHKAEGPFPVNPVKG